MSGPNDDDTFQVWSELFERLGWFVPPCVPLFRIRETVEVVEAVPKDAHAVVIDLLLVHLYDATHMARMVTDHYPHIPCVAAQVEQVRQAMAAYHLGLYRVAVAGMLPALEASIRAAGEPLGVRPNASGAKELGRVFTAMLNAIEQRGDAVDHERRLMISGIKSFFTDHLYRDTRHPGATPVLNRHIALHGFLNHDTQATPANFCRLVSLLDSLCFAVALWQHLRISGFLPNSTPQSEELRRYFLAGRGLAHVYPSGSEPGPSYGT